jgi:hypothetical protein
MFYKFINGNKPRDFASGIADHKRRKKHAGEPNVRHLTGNGPLWTAWLEGLLYKATARTRMRIKGTFATRRKSSTSRVYTAKLMVEEIGQALCFIAILGVLFVTTGRLLSEAPNGGQAPHLSARELIQDVALKEERARKNPQNYFKFVQKEITPKGTETSIRMETPQGEIGEVVSINGKPPSQERCRAETNSLWKLVTDSQIERRREREQKERMDRVENLMAAVTDAFIFQYHGKQRGTGWIEIKFYPNPRFQPRSHEASLLKGMRGTLWVDPTSHRLVKIDGTLFKDVNFGWGFLASLQRGGHFAMQQSMVPGGSWKQTFLEVDLDGSRLLFGQLHVHFKDSSQSFVRLADPPTLAKAVNVLEHSPVACRESQDTGTTAQAEIR